MTNPNRSRSAGRAGRAADPAVWRGAALTLLVVALVVLAMLAGLRARQGDRSLAGTTVAGVEVGGLDQAGVAEVLNALATRRDGRTIEVRRGDEHLVSSAGDLGYRLDVTATTVAVMARGRQSNPAIALRDQIRSLMTPPQITPVESFDPAAFDRWVHRIAEELSLPPIEGDIELVGTQVRIIQPEPGETIAVDLLRDRALAALAEPEDALIEVPTVRSAPTITSDALADLAAQAERAVAQPVVLRRGDVELTFAPATMARLLQVRVGAVSGPGGTAALELAIDPDRLVAVLPAEDFGALAAEPQDARFTLVDGQVQIIPAVDGFAFDAEVAADQLLAVATGEGPRSVDLEGRTTPPDLTTADARGLGIVEEVATFTTDHPCCQTRVTNIQRMADQVRGTVVLPGETFSLNGLVGERTAAAGYVGGGAISDGEFVEQIGGGVSQFTTTMFNTIYFGGYQIVAYKPHSYYISRYPEGREATLNFSPPVDLKFTNDSPHGIYIHTAYTDTSVTVAFWSTTFAEVTSTTSDRYGFREPAVRREPTDGLAAGVERVAQSGRQGFSVDFTRTIHYVDGRTDVQRRTTNYLAEPRIIQVGTGRPAPTEEPTEPPTTATPQPQPTQAPPSPGGTAGPTPVPTQDPPPDPEPVPRPDNTFPEDPTASAQARPERNRTPTGGSRGPRKARPVPLGTASGLSQVRSLGLTVLSDQVRRP